MVARRRCSPAVAAAVLLLLGGATAASTPVDVCEEAVAADDAGSGLSLMQRKALKNQPGRQAPAPTVLLDAVATGAAEVVRDPERREGRPAH
mmetsp:Transcript_76820/g.201558  ORF Transcript_76820/g.201558 Transcript_76820/m.201558 type:complete len:92 (-) Transcript_76820:265-540(-)